MAVPRRQKEDSAPNARELASDWYGGAIRFPIFFSVEEPSAAHGDVGVGHGSGVLGGMGLFELANDLSDQVLQRKLFSSPADLT